MNYRPHTFLGMTQSLCPECLALVQAKIVVRDGRVYFQKRCPTHGAREDFVCSDARWWDRAEYNVPAIVPRRMAVEPDHGCPFDCGLCTDHEQHTCLAVLEITTSCNLECPVCYASSAPGGKHLSVEECHKAIDKFVAAEERAEVLQLSGGEPTIHPRFLDIFRYACNQPIDIVMINTNGVRFARDEAFLAAVADQKHRAEIYLQFDGFDDDIYGALRGEALVETKLRAIERLGEAGIRTILTCTVRAGTNDDQIGRIVEYGVEQPHVTGASFQPACYTGRYELAAELDRRITFPDIIQAICAQTDGVWMESDFIPLPCAHPNGHSIAYAYRRDGTVTPVARFVDVAEHIDLLANGITFNRPMARKLIGEVLSRECCSGQGCCEPGEQALFNPGVDAVPSDAGQFQPHAESFFEKALGEALDPADVFRITTTSFMDAYNFDVRQLMRSCVHHILPTGHAIPFSAYNVLYRDGHVALPALCDASPLRSDLNGQIERGANEAKTPAAGTV